MNRANAIAALSASLLLAACDVPYSTYSIPSAAMRPTLVQGMLVGADQFKGYCGAAHPKPGDIVIIRRADVFYVKRAIAGPGQTISMQQGRLTIDGRPVAVQAVGSTTGEYGERAQIVRETLANEASYLTLDLGPDGELDNVAATKLGPTGWYLLGDNRDNSADSRIWGSVSEADICARVTSVLWAKELSRVGKQP